jgi:hypothetical protein
LLEMRKKFVKPQAFMYVVFNKRDSSTHPRLFTVRTSKSRPAPAPSCSRRFSKATRGTWRSFWTATA